MFSLLKYLFILLLFLLCTGIIGLFAYLTLTQGIDYRAVLAQPELITTGQLIAVFSLILVPTSLALLFAPLFQISPHTSRLSSFLRTVIIMLMIGFIGFQLLDTRKVYQHYARKDLIVRHPEAGKASFLLTSLLNGTLGPMPDTGHMEDLAYYQQIRTNGKEITKAWGDITPYRVVVDQLAAFSILPHPLGAVEPATPEAKTTTLRDIGRIYLAHALLQIELGNRAQGVAELTTIHQVAANGLAGSLRMEEKMTWAAVLEKTMRAAYRIVIDEGTNYEEVRQLAAACKRLTPADTSLRNVWLSEYLSAGNRLDLPAAEILEQRFPTDNDKPLLLQLLPPWMFDISYRLTFQKNRTADYLKSFWEPIIEASPANSSAFQHRWSSQTEYHAHPPLRNLSGWYFHRPPNFSNEERRVAELYRTSDLLAAYLASKLEFSDDIAAYLSDSQRIVAIDGQRIIDGGEDRVIGTADDIVLTPLF